MRLNPANNRLGSMRVRQRGVAVLTVLLIVAIGASLAYALASQQSMIMAQSRHVLVGDALNDLLIGGEVLGRQLLYADHIEGVANPPQRDHLNEEWAQAVPPFEIPGGFIEIQILDLHGCFNLNSIPTTAAAAGSGADPSTVLGQELFKVLDLDAGFHDLWFDWIDENRDVDRAGAEDNEYTGRDIPYRTPNKLAGHLSEVRLVGEMNYNQWQELQQVACVAPEPTTLNVNTLRPATIAFLNGTRPSDMTDEEREPELPDYESADDFKSAHTSIDDQILTALTLAGVVSEYFEVHIRAELDGEQASMVSTLHRDPDTGKIVVLGRDFSRRFVSNFTAAQLEDS